MPLFVKPERGMYLIFGGQRRFLASKEDGITEMLCLVFKDIELQQAQELSLCENMFRSNLSKKDKSEASKTLLKQIGDKNKVAQILGVSEKTINVWLRYYGLSYDIRKLVREDKINLQFAIYINLKFQEHAIDIARLMARTQKRTIQSKLIRKAIQDADPDATSEEIKDLCDNTISGVVYPVTFPRESIKKVERIAYTRGKKISVVLAELIMEALSDFDD